VANIARRNAKGLQRLESNQEGGTVAGQEASTKGGKRGVRGGK